MGSPWQHKVTKALDGGLSIDRVHAVFSELAFSADWICFCSVLKSGRGGGGGKEQPNRLKKKLLEPAQVVRNPSYFKEEKCNSLLDNNKLDLLFIGVSAHTPGTS